MVNVGKQMMFSYGEKGKYMVLQWYFFHVTFCLLLLISAPFT